jgi:hypothetical protein
MRACPPLALLLLALTPTPLFAQSATGTFSASINGLASLTLSSNSLTFPDANPDTVAQIAATQNPILVTAKARGARGATVTLTLLAADDLRSGIVTLPISYITWTATGAGFVGGTANKVTAQPVASWVGSGVRSGSLSFSFQNGWTHPTGVYTVTLIYTLTAP